MLAFYANPCHLTPYVKACQIAEYNGFLLNASGLTVDNTFVCCGDFYSSAFDCIKKLYIDPGDNRDVLDKFSSISATFIANDELGKRQMMERTKNPVIVIPHHHCNFDSLERPVDKPVKLVGYIGSSLGIDFNLEMLRITLQRKGMDLACLFTDYPFQASRIDVCWFLANIDISICYRSVNAHIAFNKPALKIFNPGSFRIPSVAYPELSFVENAKDCFVPALGLQDVIDKCVELKNNNKMYLDIANKAFELSKKHHIKVVSEYYKEIERCK